jgi:hypothetical protein
MRRAQRGTAWGVVCALLIGLFAAWAAAARPDAATPNTLEHAAFAAFDAQAAITSGVLYPRWSPYALGGFGSPAAHYTPPLPALFPGLASALFAMTPVAGVRLSIVVAAVVGAWGAYTIAARWSSARGGVLAAALYALSPAVALTFPYLLGDMALVVCAALLPWLWVAVDRLCDSDGPFDYASVVLGVALLMLASPSAALVSMAFSLWPPILRRGGVQAGPRLLSAYLLGVLSAAFFWLPALLEADLVVWLPATAAPPRLSLPHLLTIPGFPDPSQMRPPPVFALGAASLLTAIVSASIVLRTRQTGRPARLMLTVFTAAVFAAAALAGVLLAPGVLAWLLVSGLGIAVAGAVVLDRAIGPRVWASAVALGLAVCLNAPAWLSPPTRTPIGPIDGQAHLNYARAGYGDALAPPDRARPVPVTFALETDRPALPRGPVPVEIAPAAALGLLDAGPQRLSLQASLLNPTEVTALITAFPGWEVTLNGASVAVGADARGLLTFSLPPVERGEVNIRLGTTPPRTFAWLVSAAAVLVALAVCAQRAERPHIHAGAGDYTRPLRTADMRLIVLVMGGWAVAIGVFGWGARSVDPAALPFAPAFMPLRITTDTGLTAAGYSGLNTAYRAGETAEFVLVWGAQRPIADSLRRRLVWINLGTGVQTPAAPLAIPGGYPTQRWAVGAVMHDRIMVTLDPALPTGDYALGIALSACANAACSQGEARVFFGPDGTPFGQLLVLPQPVRIEAAASAP